MNPGKIRLNTEWLCDCGGCHVALVDLHEKILNVLEAVQILKCPVLTDEKGYPEADIGILTGSVRTEHDRQAALEMRRTCRTIIAFGTCAVYGGLHGAGLAHTREEIMDHVYRHSPSTRTDCIPGTAIPALEKLVTPIDEVIDVDLYLPGCPPHPHFIFECLKALIENRQPQADQESVCAGCRRTMVQTETAAIKDIAVGGVDDGTCFLSQGYVCQGSVTLDRCLAPCPNHGIPCSGCSGPTMQILSEPTRDIRTEIGDRMARLTQIPYNQVKEYLEKSAKTQYAYAMATKMIGNKPTFLIRKWIAEGEAR